MDYSMDEVYKKFQLDMQKSAQDLYDYMVIKGWGKHLTGLSPKVEILRPCMFFATGQIITLTKLSEYFTLIAIEKLEEDGFIKINF
jgi:hypothetical protein